jgi:hypothetical protein
MVSVSAKKVNKKFHACVPLSYVYKVKTHGSVMIKINSEQFLLYIYLRKLKQQIFNSALIKT